jgi:hypothetical protein
MGIMGTVFNRSKTGGDDDEHKRTYQGDHNLSTEQTLKPTDDNVINPLNQNSWESIRTQSVVTVPRYFSKEESIGLKKLAKEKTEGATQTKRAYKSLKQIEEADTTVHRSHRDYQKTVATTETAKQRSNASLSKKLHSLRPQYVSLGKEVERAEKQADKSVTELKAKLEAVM